MWAGKYICIPIFKESADTLSLSPHAISLPLSILLWLHLGTPLNHFHGDPELLLQCGAVWKNLQQVPMEDKSSALYNAYLTELLHLCLRQGKEGGDPLPAIAQWVL